MNHGISLQERYGGLQVIKPLTLPLSSSPYRICIAETDSAKVHLNCWRQSGCLQWMNTKQFNAKLCIFAKAVTKFTHVGANTEFEERHGIGQITTSNLVKQRVYP